MKDITLLQTYDGQIHNCQHDAQKHLDKLFSDRMCRVLERSRNLGNIEFGEWVEANLNMFVEMQAIKDDLKYEDENERF